MKMLQYDLLKAGILLIALAIVNWLGNYDWIQGAWSSQRVSDDDLALIDRLHECSGVFSWVADRQNKIGFSNNYDISKATSEAADICAETFHETLTQQSVARYGMHENSAILFKSDMERRFLERKILKQMEGMRKIQNAFASDQQFHIKKDIEACVLETDVAFERCLAILEVDQQLEETEDSDGIDFQTLMREEFIKNAARKWLEMWLRLARLDPKNSTATISADMQYEFLKAFKPMGDCMSEVLLEIPIKYRQVLFQKFTETLSYKHAEYEMDLQLIEDLKKNGGNLKSIEEYMEASEAIIGKCTEKHGEQLKNATMIIIEKLK